MVDYEQHPLSASFPAMSSDDLDALAGDILEFGQRDPATIYESKILDGWHRYQACRRANREFIAVEFQGDDPIAFVISKNGYRRHLGLGQFAQAVVKCHEWRLKGRPEINSATAAELPKTAAQIAKSTGLSVRTVERAKTIERAGLGDQVRSGDLPVRQAERIARLPEADRFAAIATPPPAEQRIHRQPDKTSPIDPPQDLAAENQALRARVDELEEAMEALDSIQQENEKLCALVDLDCDAAKLISDLQLRLNRCQATLRTTELSRDTYMRENAEMKRQIKRLMKAAKA